MQRVLLIVLVGAMVASSVALAAAQRITGDQAAKLARSMLEKSVEGIIAERRQKCMDAIGSPQFCDCLNAKLPISVDFQTYIMVTTTSREEYANLMPNNREAAGRIIATRDFCVARVFAIPK